MAVFSTLSFFIVVSFYNFSLSLNSGLPLFLSLLWFHSISSLSCSLNSGLMWQYSQLFLLNSFFILISYLTLSTPIISHSTPSVLTLSQLPLLLWRPTDPLWVCIIPCVLQRYINLVFIIIIWFGISLTNCILFFTLLFSHFLFLYVEVLWAKFFAVITPCDIFLGCLFYIQECLVKYYRAEVSIHNI